jgi:transcriptional regulator with XRE-family HTH domain
MKKNKELIKLGDGIRLERLKNKLSQEQLAEKAGICQYQHIGRIERAEINTRATTLFAIIKALNCKLEDLIDLSE